MKKLNKIPKACINSILSEQEKALLALQKKDNSISIPIHKVRMKIERPNKEPKIEDVMIPATCVSFDKSAIVEGDICDKRHMVFTLDKYGVAFPIAHVFRSSGHICFGDIYVGETTRYTPLNPLEQLFLYNDRVVNHGGACLYANENQVRNIFALLKEYGVKPSDDVTTTFLPDRNLIANDSLWILTAEITKQMSYTIAIELCDRIFDILFKKIKQEEKEDEDEDELY